jgi:hypothetical protein
MMNFAKKARLQKTGFQVYTLFPGIKRVLYGDFHLSKKDGAGKLPRFRIKESKKGGR